MIGTVLSFSAMAVGARELSFHMATFEMQFLRSLIGIIVLLPFIIYNPALLSLKGRAHIHVIRNSVHFLATYAWTLAIALLPLAQVFALEFTTPIWTTLLAIFILAERLTVPRLVAVIGGFIGVLIIVRPGIGVFNPAALLVLGSALGYGINIVTTRFLAQSTPALTIIFYMSLMQLPMSAVPTYYNWVTPTLESAPWILAYSLCGLLAHYCLARALHLADATITMPIDFARLPLIAIVGYLFYSEALDPWVFAGAIIIFAVNYYAVKKEHHK